MLRLRAVSQVRKRRSIFLLFSCTIQIRATRGIITARSARDQKPPKAKYKDSQRAGLHSVLPRLLADAVRRSELLQASGAGAHAVSGA